MPTLLPRYCVWKCWRNYILLNANKKFKKNTKNPKMKKETPKMPKNSNKKYYMLVHKITCMSDIYIAFH